MSHDAVFTALASPVRREVLRILLVGGARSVQALAEHFDMQRPSLSEHLKVLKDAGLVSEQKQGRFRYYSLEAAPLHDLTEWLSPYEQFWRQKLRGLRDLLDEEEDDL